MKIAIRRKGYLKIYNEITSIEIEKSKLEFGNDKGEIVEIDNKEIKEILIYNLQVNNNIMQVSLSELALGLSETTTIVAFSTIEIILKDKPTSKNKNQ